MARAHYTYDLKSYAGHPVIAIIDQDNGGISVTNDIETVVAEIAVKEKLDPARYLVVYQDSEKIWDGWDVRKGYFLPLRQPDITNALTAYLAVKGYSLN